MKITFVLPVVSDARFRKRLEILKRMNSNVKVLAFERNYYKGVPLDEYTSLGVIEHGKYHKRIIPYFKSLFKIRKALHASDVIYVFGLDLLLTAYLASFGINKSVKIVYEVADIRSILLHDSLLSKALRHLERYLIKRINLLVVTSEDYISGYYKGILSLKHINYHVVENKIDKRTMPSKSEIATKKNNSRAVIKIGYFGLIRCQRSWETLKKVVKKSQGRIHLYIRGIVMGVDNVEEEISKIKDITYGGAYTSPDDLPEIYDSVDIVWACYPYQGSSIGNWRWARTNRFYESCFFKKPMIVQKGTVDGKEVEKFGLGICIDLSNPDETVQQILNIKHNDINKWRLNIEQLPEKKYIYTDEHVNLLKKIRS